MFEPEIQFHSTIANSTWSRSFYRAKYILRCNANGDCGLSDAAGTQIRHWDSPLDALNWLGSSEARAFDWAGFLSYDLGRWFEKIPSIAKDDLNLPIFIFTAHESRSAHSVSIAPVRIPDNSVIPRIDVRPVSTFTPDQYLRTVQRVIDYIAAGDIFQVNLAQRFSVQSECSPRSIYMQLLKNAQAAYGGLLNYGDFSLICNSPELFLHVDANGRITTRPIKGTRPRRPGMEEELRTSQKDQAELNMIVDLERNDLGRICKIGSVRVTQPRTIETHPTVYHGVATIEGHLRDDITFLDILRATFPGGSITGAPKIRAMEIIEELEPVRRGPYCGAIGYLGADGTIEFNIAIRTMIAKDGTIHIPVGGGIVADSDPATEFVETLVKAQAMFAALGISLPQNPPPPAS